MNILAQNISRRRRELKMTQKQLADKLNISDKTVSRWETGIQVPDGLTIPEIAAALQTSIGQLYGQQDDTNIPFTVDSGAVASYKSAMAAVVITLLLSSVIVHKSYSTVGSYVFFAALAVAAVIMCRAEIKFRAFYKGSVLEDEYRKINHLYLGFTCFASLIVFNLLYKTLTPFSVNYVTESIHQHFPKYHLMTFIVNSLMLGLCFKKHTDKKTALLRFAGIIIFCTGFCLYVIYPDPTLGELWTMTEINARKNSQYLFFAGSILFTAAHWINFSHFKKSLQGENYEEV